MHPHVIVEGQVILSKMDVLLIQDHNPVMSKLLSLYIKIHFSSIAAFSGHVNVIAHKRQNKFHTSQRSGNCMKFIFVISTL